MFHLLIGLLAIGCLVFVISVILIGVVTIVAGLVGGTSAALLVKNKTYKRLLFIGFCIIFLFGILCLTPIITSFASLSAVFFTIASVLITICIAALAIAGIKISQSINNKIGRTVLTIAFCIVLIAALSSIILILLAKHFLV